MTVESVAHGPLRFCDYQFEHEFLCVAAMTLWCTDLMRLHAPAAPLSVLIAFRSTGCIRAHLAFTHLAPLI